MNLLERGGWILIAIGVLSFAAWSLIVWTALELRDRSRGGTGWVAELVAGWRTGARIPESARGGLIAELAEVALTRGTATPRWITGVLRPRLHGEAAALGRWLDLIGTLATSLPLLGLLGTVLGMIVTFEALTQRGSAEVEGFADGVSQALLTTQAGLLTALPALVARGYLRSRLRRFQERAERCLHQFERALRDETTGGS